MSHQEILERAIQKAAAGGLIKFGYERPELEWFNEDEKTFAVTWHDPLEYDTTKQSYHSLFDHDFARALWGLEPRWHGELRSSRMIAGEGVHLENWANCDYHRMMMVTADDPIEYLGENI